MACCFEYPEPESVFAALHRGYRVVELPVVMRPRRAGVSSIRHLDSLLDLSSVIADKQSPAALFAFSHEHGLSAYDSAYLILARSLGVPVATLDKKMRKVAARVGVKTFNARIFD